MNHQDSHKARGEIESKVLCNLHGLESITSSKQLMGVILKKLKSTLNRR